MKKILALFLVALMIFSLVAVNVVAADDSDVVKTILDIADGIPVIFFNRTIGLNGADVQLLNSSPNAANPWQASYYWDPQAAKEFMDANLASLSDARFYVAEDCKTKLYVNYIPYTG